MSILRSLDWEDYDLALRQLDVYFEQNLISKEMYDKLMEYIVCQKTDTDQD